jgi:hypothetical protein
MSDASPPNPTPTDEIAPAPVLPLPPPNEKSAPRRRVQVPLSASLGALLVLALAMVATAPYWAPPLLPLLPWSKATTTPASSQTAQRLDAIEQQLANVSALNSRIGALESKPTPDASAAIAPVAAQVQSLSTHLDQIDSKLSQLQHDETANADSAERVLMIALASLGNAVADSRPFSAELSSVEALGQNRAGWAAALQPLEGAAKTGLPSTAILAQRFANETAPAILRAEAQGPTTQQDLWHAMLAKLKGLIIIRRIDRSVGGATTTDAAVDAAQAALDKGDLNGAVTALDGLRGGPADAAQPWLKDAKQRLAAEQTIAKLSQEIAGDLASDAHNG